MAGSDNINASRIIPFIPSAIPTGSSQEEIIDVKGLPFITALLKIHMTAPAGADTITARESINSVFSHTARFRDNKNLGRLYGGISNINSETSLPLTVVMNLVASNDIHTDNNRKKNKTTAATAGFDEKKIAISVINVGNLPLQGMNELVRIAAVRSFGDDIMRVPVTATALHPIPKDIVSACLPQLPHLLKI